MFRQNLTIEEQRQLRATNIVSASAATVDLSTLATIFFLLSKEMLKIAFEKMAKYILLPVAAAANIIQAVFAWRKAYLENGEGNAVRTAIVETIGAAMITTAVIGSLVASAVFAVVGPALFAAAFTMKTLFNFGNAIYNGVLAARERNPEMKTALRAKAIESTIGGVVGVIATAAVVGVMLLGKVAMTIAGIIAGVAGATLAIKKVTELANQSPGAEVSNQVNVQNQGDRDYSSSARMGRALGSSRSNSSTNLLADTDFDVSNTDTDLTQEKPGQVVTTTPVNDTVIEEERKSPRLGSK